MQRDYDGLARQRLKRALLDKLAERYDFPVPPGMVEMEFNVDLGAIPGRARGAPADRGAGRREPERGRSRAGGGRPMAARSTVGNVIAPEETALEGASERAPATAEAEKPAEHETDRGGSPRDPASGVERRAGRRGGDHRAGGDRARRRLRHRTGRPDERDGGRREETREEFRRIAERRVRLGLLLAEVGRNNNIHVTQDELNQALLQEARRHPGYERQVFDYYRKNPDALNNLRAPIFEDKVVDFIVELAKPAERSVTPQELLAAGQRTTEKRRETAPA